MPVPTSNSNSITVNAFYDVVTLHVFYVYVTVKACQDAVEFSSASRCCFSASEGDSGNVIKERCYFAASEAVSGNVIK